MLSVFLLNFYCTMLLCYITSTFPSQLASTARSNRQIKGDNKKASGQLRMYVLTLLCRFLASSFLCISVTNIALSPQSLHDLYENVPLIIWDCTCVFLRIFTGFAQVSKFLLPEEVVEASKKKVLIKRRECGLMYPHT